MKKRKGSILNALLSLMVIIAFAIMVTSFIDLTKIVSYKENIKQISRSYMLEMETVGYLSAGSRATLLQELADMHLQDIDLSGTTQVSVGYGNDIVLSVKGSIPTQKLNLSSDDMLSFFFDSAAVNIEIYMQSTAKH